jgi:hypothetical protein
VTKLPEGFTVDKPPTAKLPEGFKVDEPSFLSKVGDFYQKHNTTGPLQAADDMARIGADAVTRGYLDKWLGPEEQAKTQAARERAGWAGTGMDVASTYATTPLKAVTSAPGFVGGAVNALGYGAQGAGYGALSAGGHDQDIEQGALVGGLLGLGGSAVPSVASGASKALGGYGGSWWGPLAGFLTGDATGAAIGLASKLGAKTAAPVVGAAARQNPQNIVRGLLATQ